MKKIIIPSVILLVIAVASTVLLWFTIGAIARLNPELNLSGRGMVPELQPENETCTGDQVCMRHPEVRETRAVPSSCDGDTDDVGVLEAQGWTRCAAVSSQNPEPSSQ